MKNRVFETVLYYTPEPSEKAVKLKGVLVRMGIRIKNISPEQAGETIGSLLGIAGYEKNSEEDRAAENEEKALPVMAQEMLVMHRFSERRLDELLMNLRFDESAESRCPQNCSEGNCNRKQCRLEFWSFI